MGQAARASEGMGGLSMDKETHHETAHSATYSTETMQPSTLQYISHLSISSSEAGRLESVL